MMTVLGVFVISIPLICISVFMVKEDGWACLAFCWGTVAVVCGCVCLGLWMISL